MDSWGPYLTVETELASNDERPYESTNIKDYLDDIPAILERSWIVPYRSESY